MFSKVTHSRPALAALCLLTLALAWWLRRAYERTRLQDDEHDGGNCLVEEEEEGASTSQSVRKAGRVSRKVKAKASGGRHKRYASVQQTAEEEDDDYDGEKPEQHVRGMPGAKTQDEKPEQHMRRTPGAKTHDETPEQHVRRTPGAKTHDETPEQHVRRTPGAKTRGHSAGLNKEAPPEPLGRERRAKATASRSKVSLSSQGRSGWQEKAEARLTGEARQVGRALD